MDSTLTAENIYNKNLSSLGENVKKRLIELLSKSLSSNKDKDDSDSLFNEICGAWKDDGLTADEEIDIIKKSRTQGVTRK